jgi:glycosyltransferase involved in cell wall biosynthesis
MKVALLSPWFLPDTGGAERYAYELAVGLARRGHDVTVFAVTRVGTPDNLPESVSFNRLFPRKKLPFIQTIAYNLFARRTVPFEKFDIVHGTLMPASTVALSPGIGMADLPIVLTSHGTSLGEARANNPDSLIDYVFKYGVHPSNVVLDNIAGRVADRIIAISDHAERQLRDVYRFGDKVTMIPHGVDTERFAPTDKRHPAVDESKLTVLTVGRLGPRKGIGLTIDAVAQTEGVEFLIAGTGRREERLRERARRHGVSDRITFLGYVPDDELPALYSSADIFTLTSRYEGFGLVLLEAMACRTPAIGTAAGGIPTVIDDGETGFLVTREADLVAAKLRRLRDFECRERMSQAAYEYAKTMDWNKIVERVEVVYESVSECY